MQKLGIALVGCGAISKVHLDIIKNNNPHSSHEALMQCSPPDTSQDLIESFSEIIELGLYS